MNIIGSFEAVVIGAGVVGLAIAGEAAGVAENILVLEKNENFGMETSSRSSEVIHAGIYYPTGFLKARLCTEGKALLYDYCLRKDIPHRRLGKLIVATNPDESAELDRLSTQAENNGVTDLVRIGKRELSRLEPEVEGREALFSPSTGIIDSHRLMRALYLGACEKGATIAFRTPVTAIAYDGRSYRLEINRGEYQVETRVLINAAGLYADRIAAMAGLDLIEKGYKQYYCKGSYFSVSPAPRLKHLVYPAPPKNTEGLGIHATLDLSGRIRFGPDVEYTDTLDYRVDPSRRGLFYESIKTYLPEIALEDLQPEMSGIRPKLQGPGEPYRDFLIREEKEAGLPGLINLIGIESPGLTSCLAIGRMVASLMKASVP